MVGLRNLVAGIVTFNPDMKRLRENLSAICPQVGNVIVYDNASENVTEIKALAAEFESVTIICGEENGGLAVALNRLGWAALEMGAQAIILLDQDSVASSELVATMLPYLKEDVGIVSPLVVDRNEDERHASRADVYEVPRAITSGSLLSLSAFFAVGGYDERLFVDWVDFDFSYTLRLAGYRVLRVERASLLHELGSEEFARYIPRRNRDGKWEMRPYYRTNHALWRVRDRARSQAIVLHKYKGTQIGKAERPVVLKSFFRGVLNERHKVRYVKAFVSGYLEGSRIARLGRENG